MRIIRDLVLLLIVGFTDNPVLKVDVLNLKMPAQLLADSSLKIGEYTW